MSLVVGNIRPRSGTQFRTATGSFLAELVIGLSLICMLGAIVASMLAPGGIQSNHRRDMALNGAGMTFTQINRKTALIDSGANLVPHPSAVLDLTLRDISHAMEVSATGTMKFCTAVIQVKNGLAVFVEPGARMYQAASPAQVTSCPREDQTSLVRARDLVESTHRETGLVLVGYPADDKLIERKVAWAQFAQVGVTGPILPPGDPAPVIAQVPPVNNPALVSGSDPGVVVPVTGPTVIQEPNQIQEDLNDPLRASLGRDPVSSQPGGYRSIVPRGVDPVFANPEPAAQVELPRQLGPDPQLEQLLPSGPLVESSELVADPLEIRNRRGNQLTPGRALLPANQVNF